MEFIDFNDCMVNERNGTYGGMAGSKEGITYNGNYWIIKYPKNTKDMNDVDISYTTAPLSEYIGSHIYQELGYDVHETLLGFRNNKLVVACKDFCLNRGDLLEIRTLKNTYNEELENRLNVEISSTGSQHMIEIKEILIHLDNNPILSNIHGLKERFWDCVVIDGLINNNDRNNGNWGILLENNTYKISPIFDNGASFSNKLSDEKIRTRLKNFDNLRMSAVNIATAYSDNGKRFTYKKILSFNNEDLKDAIMKNTKLISDKMGDITNLLNSIPNVYKGIPIITEERKNFYLKSMEIRFNELILPRYLEICKERNIQPDKTIDIISLDCFGDNNMADIEVERYIEDDFEDRDI